jgi:hypothetical protein
LTYDYKNELKKVKEYYAGDPLQKRFSALICGESGVGKTFLLRSCRRPVHVDSFDPGGTKCLRKWIDSGDIIADTQWEGEDPLDPDRFDRWKKATELRLHIGYFNHFGTYCLDSATTFATSAMNSQLKAEGKAGDIPVWERDYVPQKNAMTIYLTKLMALSCDFILTGHLDKKERLISVDKKTGVKNSEVTYRFLTTGKAVVTIPLLFDELYVMRAFETAHGLERRIVTEAQGEYIARSRLKGHGVLDAEEPADIKALLKKIGLSWEDKPRLEDVSEISNPTT